ncbi:MAG: DJ-1/PfpI family protein [Zetaproteobacteria bacterium]|nr:DJ-1/PfpI family protein [Zetaproteobacteria bacterium]
MIKVIVPFTEGVEEIELITIVDTLRRAEIEVCMASIGTEKTVIGRSNIPLIADAIFAHVVDHYWDAIILPGGVPNAFLLAESADVKRACSYFHNQQRTLAAICAAPFALASFGLLHGKKITAYPSMKEKILSVDATILFETARVIEDGNILTSQGPGTALLFSLALINKLCDNETALRIGQEMITDNDFS